MSLWVILLGLGLKTAKCFGDKSIFHTKMYKFAFHEQLNISLPVVFSQVSLRVFLTLSY